MPTQTLTIRRQELPHLRDVIRSLPAVLTGRAPDIGGIARGLTSRLAFGFLSLVRDNFERKSRGEAGDDGKPWKPLSQAYLAYGRRWSGQNKRHASGRVTPLAGGRWPGGKDGFMSDSQERQWWVDYKQVLSFLIQRHSPATAKGIAAGAATNRYKERGGETKWDSPKLGKRQPGVGYAILRDTGNLANSLSPGSFTESGVSASYSPNGDQKFEQQPGQLFVGTNVFYAGAHHSPKDKSRQRRLWPEKLPTFWMDDLVSLVRSGLLRIPEVLR